MCVCVPFHMYGMHVCFFVVVCACGPIPLDIYIYIYIWTSSGPDNYGLTSLVFVENYTMCFVVNRSRSP